MLVPNHPNNIYLLLLLFKESPNPRISLSILQHTN